MRQQRDVRTMTDRALRAEAFMLEGSVATLSVRMRQAEVDAEIERRNEAYVDAELARRGIDPTPAIERVQAALAKRRASMPPCICDHRKEDHPHGACIHDDCRCGFYDPRNSEVQR